MRSFKCSIFAACVLLIFSIGISSTMASDYPARPITLICPWGAGGGTDAVSRIIATLLKKELGIPINVVNRTGGGGAVGHSAMATAKPDGYTIGMATVEISMMHWMGVTEVTFEGVEPIALVNFDAAGINVSADAEWSSYAELERFIKENPGKLMSSGTGPGGIWHLAMAGWLKTAGISPDAIKWIPSKGAAPALQDILAGGISMTTCSLPEASTLIDAKKIKPLAVMADTRNPNFPDTPTLKELGVDWSCGTWRGIVAPRGTPVETIAVIEKALKKVVESTDFIKFMENRGYGVTWKDSAQFAEHIKKADLLNGEIMEAAGIR